MGELKALAPLREGWKGYQQKLIAAIAPLTPTQLSFQAAPHLRPVATLAAHIIAARVWWFHFVMQEGPDELKPLVVWDDDGEPARPAAELVAGLEQTWAMIDRGLERWVAADLATSFAYRWPGSNDRQAFTRQWIIWHVLEHDLHHGGELSLTLGARGLRGIAL